MDEKFLQELTELCNDFCLRLTTLIAKGQNALAIQRLFEAEARANKKEDVAE